MIPYNLAKILRRRDYFKFVLLMFIGVGLVFSQKQWNYSFFYLYALADPIRSIPDTLLNWYHKVAALNLKSDDDSLQNRVDYLENQNFLLTSQVYRLSLIKQQNAELLKLLEVKISMPDFGVKLAQVKRVSNAQLPYEISINLSINDGIKVGQTVVDSRGIIGRVSHVGLVDSKVLLLNAPSISISVYNKRNGLRSVAHGSSTGMRLKSPDKRLSILPNDLFLATGLGGVFPTDFPVAKVVSVQTDRYMIMAHMQTVVPAYDLKKVLVLVPKQ